MKKWLEKRIRKRASPYIKERLHRLYPAKNEDELLLEFYTKKLRLVVLVPLMGVFLCLVLLVSERQDLQVSAEGEILRESESGQDLTIPVTVLSQEYGDMDIDIQVGKKGYSKEALEVVFAEAGEWLEATIVGENESLSCVRSNLVFPENYQDTDIGIFYTSSDYGLIRQSGEVQNEDLKEPQTVMVTAQLCYGEAVKEYDYEVCVYPVQLTKEEEFRRILSELLLAEDLRQKETDRLVLPTEVDGVLVQYREQMDKAPLYILLLSLLCAVLLYKGMDKDLDKLYEERQRKLRFEYPDFVSSLALLVGAGMSVTGAIRRIYGDKKGDHPTPLYEELGIFVRNMDNGVLEERALEDFGKRCALVPYRKFCSLLCIHMKKGSLNLQNMLEKEAQEAFEDHQLQIRQLGEEAGTKLLLPMILMLVIVMVLIMVPAFLSYQIT